MNRTWRVGILFSDSGITGVSERALRNASLLAIEEINAKGGVLGQKIEPVIYDPQSSPRLYREYAERLLGIDNARIIMGCHMSSTRKAVLPIVEAHRGLLFYPTFYEGFEFSPRCIYGGATPMQSSFQLMQYLNSNASFGPRRFVLVGSNYVFPYESNRLMTDLVVQSGGQVLDEIYLDLEFSGDELEGALKRIAQAEPDLLFVNVVGDDMVRFYTALRDFGLTAANLPIASLTTSEIEIAQMRPDVASGCIIAAPFFDTLPSVHAQRFVEAYRAKHGSDALVSATAEAAYSQVRLYAQALAMAGTDEPDLMLSKLAGMEFDAPQGHIRIDPQNNHTELWPRVATVGADKRCKIVKSAFARIKPDPYCIGYSFDDRTTADFDATSLG